MIDVKPYFSFDGVSTRSQYWAVNLFSYLMFMLSALISALFMMSGILGIISGAICMLASCIALTWLVFAVTIRRCRDIGISPWFAIALIIPYIAIIPFIVFGCLKSEEKNEHTCC